MTGKNNVTSREAGACLIKNNVLYLYGLIEKELDSKENEKQKNLKVNLFSFVTEKPKCRTSMWVWSPYIMEKICSG